MQYGVRAPQEGWVQAVGPEDLNTGANAGTWISMANYDFAEVHIFIGDVAGGAAAVTLDQATDTSGTGSKTLSFTRYYMTGQKLKFDGRSTANFSAAETITGGTSANTAYVVEVSSNHLLIATTTGSTTWTDDETITGGTSGATASVDGTGQDEDLILERTAASNTFSTLAVTFKHYMIPVSREMLDVDNDFDCFQIDIAQAASSETQGCAFYCLKGPRYKAMPMVSAIGTNKIV